MDERILFLINREWTNPFLDRVMVVMSSYDFWTPFLLVAVLLVGWRGAFRARAMLATLAVVLVVLNQGVEIAKKYFDRPRPNQHLVNVRWIDLDQQTSPRFLALGKPLFEKINPEPLPTGKGKGRAFPSGHTVNLFGVATVLAVFYRRRGWLAYFVAALVGYSRVYTGSHHPSDVLVTALLSVSTTLLVIAALGWLWSKLGPRLAPALLDRHPMLV